METLTVELAKCKSDNEHESELVCMEHMNEVQRLKAHIEELIVPVKVSSEVQGLPSRDIIKDIGEMVT